MPDLMEKISDAKESAREKETHLKDSMEQGEASKGVVFETPETLAANPAADITNLVRKSTKRVLDSSDNQDVKKTKIDSEAENLETNTN